MNAHEERYLFLYGCAIAGLSAREEYVPAANIAKQAAAIAREACKHAENQFLSRTPNDGNPFKARNNSSAA